MISAKTDLRHDTLPEETRVKRQKRDPWRWGGKGERISSSRHVLGIAIGDVGVSMALCRVNDAGGIYPFSVQSAPFPNQWDGVPALEELGQTISTVYERVRQDSWGPISAVFLCLPSWNIKKRDFQYEFPVHPPFAEIRQEHLDTMMSLIQQVAVAGSDVIIDVVPQFYLLDNVKKVQTPLGMVAEKIELHALLLLTDRGTVQSLLDVLRKLNLTISDLVSPQVAAGCGVLTPDEWEAGVVLVDIGQQNTCCSYYYGGRMFNSHVIPIGGRAISLDIARALQTSCNRIDVVADRKRELLLLPSRSDGNVSLQPFGSQELARIPIREIDNVIGYSIERLLGGLIESLQIAQGYMDFATAGMVFTGENSLALRGIMEVARRRINMPVRIGYPRHIDDYQSHALNSPDYARLVGVIHHSFNRKSENKDYLEHFYETPGDHLRKEIKRIIRHRMQIFLDQHLR